MWLIKIIMWMFSKHGKCEFVKHCKCFVVTSVTCIKDGGDYYGAGRPAGCYRSLKEKGKLSTYWKEA